MRLPGKARARIGINIYKNACCDRFMNRLAVNQDIENMIRVRGDIAAWQNENTSESLYKVHPKAEGCNILGGMDL